jgi:hypothetical protein
MTSRLAILVAALALVPSLALGQQTPSLQSYLCSGARCVFARQPDLAATLTRLETSPLAKPELQRLLASEKAVPFLRVSLPRLLDLAAVPGINDLVQRFARNGQGVSYELAVAHAYRADLRSLPTFDASRNEIDGQLRSGVILESKSAEPSRPEHLAVQIRRRAQGNARVLLALNYTPSPSALDVLKKLGRELGGRLEVQQIPFGGNAYAVLVPGLNFERPADRQLVSHFASPEPPIWAAKTKPFVASPRAPRFPTSFAPQKRVGERRLR